MAYTPYYATWHDADSVTGGGDTSTPLVAAALQHIEDGIGAVADDADVNTAAIAALTGDFPSAAAIAASANDVPVWDGSGWVRASGTPTKGKVLKGNGSWEATAVAVTALPGSPVDGQEVVLTDSLTAPTYSWLCRYDESISGTYKWEVLGGSISKGPSGSLTTSSTAFVDVTSGPTFTLPNAGIYRIQHGAFLQNNAATGSGYNLLAALSVSAATAVNQVMVVCPTLSSGTSTFLGATGSTVNQVTVTGVAALKIQARVTSAVSSTFSAAWFVVVPLYII